MAKPRKPQKHHETLGKHALLDILRESKKYKGKMPADADVYVISPTGEVVRADISLAWQVPEEKE